MSGTLETVEAELEAFTVLKCAALSIYDALNEKVGDAADGKPLLSCLVALSLLQSKVLTLLEKEGHNADEALSLMNHVTEAIHLEKAESLTAQHKGATRGGDA